MSLLLLLVAVTGIASVAAKSNYVPESACRSMIPLGHVVDPQQTQAPYVVQVPTEGVPAGSQINVVLSGMTPSVKFKGFFVKAFDQVNQVIGRFIDAPRTVQCDGPDTGATHGDSVDKDVVVLTWEAPQGYIGKVHFMATIVMQFDVFWTGVASNELTLV